MSEFSAAKRVDTDAERAKEVARVLKSLQALDPNNVHCATILIVEKTGENGKNKIHSHIIGTDTDIAQMLTMQVNMVRNGLVQMNTPPPTDEVQH